jgi:hypothetical protein
MLGLSITAIGLRPINECLNIFQTLQKPMELDFLELAIGSPCSVDFDYSSIPLILHDSCFYKDGNRRKLDLLQTKTWQVYAEFIAGHNVRVISLHPPRRNECTKQELEAALSNLEEELNIPVYVEVMPTKDYWCSSLETLVNRPLLVDVSHILIWHQGDRDLTQQTCLSILNSMPVGEIHLSHNNGQADTHDLIPTEIWFAAFIEKWSENYWVTYESLPSEHLVYQRLDKRRFKINNEIGLLY